MVLAIPIAVGLAWRTVVVAPRQAATARVAAAVEPTGAALKRVSLPMLAVPAFGEPSPGDPQDEPAPLGSEDATTLGQLELRLAPMLATAPTVADVPRLLAPARLARGQDRLARLAWEALLSSGSGAAVEEARVGLAVVAIRIALRREGEQDRSFALERALGHLAEVPEESPWADDARFDRAVALVLLDRNEEAMEQLDDLSDERSELLSQWMSSR